jgi:hypothetical protein
MFVAFAYRHTHVVATVSRDSSPPASPPQSPPLWESCKRRTKALVPALPVLHCLQYSTHWPLDSEHYDTRCVDTCAHHSHSSALRAQTSGVCSMTASSSTPRVHGLGTHYQLQRWRCRRKCANITYAR